MDKLCTLGGATIAGYAGWYLGALLGLEFFGCFVVSGLASVAGVWLGWRLAQRLK